MSYSAKISTNSQPLNMRTGPGTNFDVIGSIPIGTDVTVNNYYTVDGGWVWADMSYNGQDCYCCIQEPGADHKYIDIDYNSNAQDTSASNAYTDAPAPAVTTADEEGESLGLDSFLTSLMAVSINDGKLLKASTRMFGLPLQYPSFIDCRVDNVSSTLGRKYIENIIMGAPIMTIIPGKPLYLPGAKNKRNTAHALVSAASGNFAELAALGKDIDIEELRWFDFQQTYNEYMLYVNILCRVGACFLEIGDHKFGSVGIPLSQYNWKNYRYTEDSYSSTFTGLTKAGGAAAGSMLDTLKGLGGQALSKLKNILSLGDGATAEGGAQSNILYNDEEAPSDDLLSTLDSLLANMNFVQFYMDPNSSSFGDSSSNSTTTSKLEGLFDKGSEMIKELAFIANSGGVDSGQFQDFGNKSLDTLTDEILKGNSGITSFMSRITSGLSTVVKGENMIIPEIYQRSDYSRNYSISIRLVSPCNDRFSYFINVFVPLMHLVALALPKQGTANTYAAPFIIKAYLPGMFACNLGIIEGMNVDKTGKTVDGLAQEIKVTLTIKDLYSDLMMTPSNKPMLLLSNTSLIDYLAINCGLDLIMPQMQKKISYVMNVMKNAMTDIPNNVVAEMTEKIDNVVSAWTRL